MRLEENKEKFEELGISILIIVGQKKEAVEKFVQKQNISFPFLCDVDRNVIKAFDVFHLIGIDAINIARPSTFLISTEGKIMYSYVSKNQTDRPSTDDILKQTKQLLSEI